METSSICLNMIVKNEAHVIKNTLENLCNYINFSYYVISDTGSTDDTINIIKEFFDNKNIKGEIFNDTWKDFGYNRTLALKHAYKKTKYLLIFDADDKIFGTFNLPKILNKDGYHLKFGNGVNYKRVLLVNNDLTWIFKGVLHEYITCTDSQNISLDIIEGNYFVDSGKTGNRSQDPQKYHKDSIILENAYYEAEKENDNIKIRYSFYCAQSYRDSNQKEKAIEWYKKRVSLKDWGQEIYFSYYSIGKLYYELNEIEKAIYYWSLAFEGDKERYEAIYEIIVHFRKNDIYNISYQYYLMISNINPNLNDKLFLYKPIYDYLLKYEMIFIFYYNNKFIEGISNFKEIFLINSIPLNLKLNIIESFVFYLTHSKHDITLNENYLDFIKNIYHTTKNFSKNHLDKINITINKLTSLYNYHDLIPIKNKIINKEINNKEIKVFLSITSCKRYDLFIKTVDSFLICCKDIHLIDYFFCIDDNSSDIDKENMSIKYPFFKFYFKTESEKGHLNSINLIWNKLNELKPKYWIHLEDDWLFIKPCDYINKCINFLENNKNNNIHQILFNKNYGETINCYNLVGGSNLNDDFILHIKDESDLQSANCAYWPHYSFRPSMILTETILKLGNYNSCNIFFERDYANKYYNNGYKSAFFNEITCLHIGKLTSDKNSFTKNAYQLNNVNQFSLDNEFQEKFNKYKYVYLNEELVNESNFEKTSIFQKIFLNNNFGSNKNIIYNLLTHIYIWKRLEFDEDYDSYIILPYHINILNENQEVFNNKDIIIFKNNLNNLYTYIITKSFSKKIFNYINQYGIIDKNINDLFQKVNNLSIITIDNIILDLDEKLIKNNINNEDSFFNLLNESKDEIYIFLENKDHFGDDINFKKIEIDELKMYADINKNVIGFNTLGYIKNMINIDTLIDLNISGKNNNNGLYININRYNKKYNKNDDNKLMVFKNKIIQDYEINNIQNIDYLGLINYLQNNKECIGFCTDGSFKNNINIAYLIESEKYDTIINMKKYINYNYNNFSISNTLIQIIDEYVFIKGYNTEGYEIEYIPNLSINQVINHSKKNNYGIFNNNGYFKSGIDLYNLKKCSDVNGLFIKKEIFLNHNFIKLMNINTLDEDYKDETVDNYIAFNSLGFFKKNIDLKNIINIPDIYNNFLCINIDKYIKNKINTKKYTRIKLICNWLNSIDLCYSINKMSYGSLYWNNIQFTWEDDLVDYFIIINEPFEDTYYIPEKTIIIENILNHKINGLKNIEFKNNLDSNKFMKIIPFNESYKYTIWNIPENYISLTNNIINKISNNFCINNNNERNTDIDNKNFIEYFKNNKLINNTYIHLYKYCIILDNTSNIYDAILSECFCFVNINMKESLKNVIYEEIIVFINISNIEESMKIINNSISNNIWKSKIDSIKKEKINILNNLNFCNNIEKLIF